MTRLAVTIQLLLLAAIGNAETLLVPGDQPTIQAAIEAASEADTILVAPGRYYENINLLDKNLVVSSQFLTARDPQWIHQTVIDGSQPAHPDSASCVRITGGQDRTTVLQGFTLTGGHGTVWTDAHGAGDYREGGGVLVEFSSPILQHNLIHGNYATDPTDAVSAGGGGIRAGDGDPLIRNNVIINNQGRYGPGVVLNYATGILRNNVIADNIGGYEYGGGGISKIEGGTTILENNTIVNNGYAIQGGGVWTTASFGFEMTGNIIRGNTAQTNPQIGVTQTTTVEYCNVEGGYDGTGNIDLPAALLGEYYYSGSGGYGVGDLSNPLPAYNDPEAPATPGEARWPAIGTTRGDLGAFGGPGSYPLDWISIRAGVQSGWIPLDVTFYGRTWLEESGWSWDFGDGQTGTTATPSHTYLTPGLKDVTVAVDTGGGEYALMFESMVACLSDTLEVQRVVFSSDRSVVVEIMARNTAPLDRIIIPLEYSGAFELEFDSFSVVGCRSEYFEDVSLIGLDPGGNRMVVQLRPSTDGSQPDLEPGYGPVLKFWFRVIDPVSIGQAVNLLISGYGSYSPQFAGDLVDFAPAVKNGWIAAGVCCTGKVGDANGSGGDEPTIGDIGLMLGALFIEEDWTLIPCLAEADIDQNGGDYPTTGNISIGDVSLLIDRLFISSDWTQLPDCL